MSAAFRAEPGFITLEGGEGAGKSSNIAFIRDWLQTRGARVHVTREPGGTPLGESVRALLLDARRTDMAPVTELLLMFAARAQHLEEVIRPALARGEWVICDRFTDSSYAYQGGGRGLDWDFIAELECRVQCGLVPHLTLWLDTPVELGMARTRDRGETADRFENEQALFYERVRAAFARRASADPKRMWRVDASQPLEDVRLAIASALEACWGAM
ncbi:MAG: dTMP kinase [Halothiobacillaceae bacterium]|nr:dTMP kinase [Halothiobacillaceae bacterium]